LAGVKFKLKYGGEKMKRVVFVSFDELCKKIEKANFSKKSEAIVEAVEKMMEKKELKKKPKQREVENGHKSE